MECNVHAVLPNTHRRTLTSFHHHHRHTRSSLHHRHTRSSLHLRKQTSSHRRKYCLRHNPSQYPRT